MENACLIVGLGNPGREYSGTRHNAGFMVVERLAARWTAEWREERKFQCRLARAERSGRTALLAQPLTFMNRSGESVAAVMHFFRLEAARLLVAVDDADLPLGEIRMRTRGSSGGHHGLEDIQDRLGTDQFARLRVGIGRETGAARAIAGYVLGRFAPGEQAWVERILDRAADQAECWLCEGADKAMSRYNGKVEPPSAG